MTGFGVDKDFSIAADLFQQAAKQGVTSAQYNLGNLYYDGKGVTRNRIKAYAWMLVAKHRGHKNAAQMATYIYPKVSSVDRRKAKNLADSWIRTLPFDPPASLRSSNKKDNLGLVRYVSVNSLNYRSSPDGSKLGAFSYGTRITVYEKLGEWVRISKSGENDRWMKESFLVATKPTPKSKSRKEPFSVTSCKRSFYELARRRGVSIDVVLNTKTAFLARVPVQNSSYYDFVKCSSLDGKKAVERLSY